MVKQIENSSYKVDCFGNVFNKKGRKLKPSIDQDGYTRVVLFDNGKMKRIRIHRIVLMTFCPTDDKDLVVNHKNYLRDDNRLENLEWATRDENNKNKLKLDKATKKLLIKAIHRYGKDKLNEILLDILK